MGYFQCHAQSKYERGKQIKSVAEAKLGWKPDQARWHGEIDYRQFDRAFDSRHSLEIIHQK